MLDMKMMMISLVQQLEHPANEFDHHVRCKNALLVLQQWIGALRIKPSHVHLLSYTLQLICRFESPNYPTVRLDLQKEAIELIQWMLKYFPMCAFHQGTTRFAIGLASGVVEVWNVSEAEREKSFEGHRGAVSALSFRSDGKILVTFSEVEGNVKTWTLGVFSSIKSFLGFSSSKNKKHGVKKLKTTPANNMEYFARARISWKNDTNVILIRFENKDEGYDPINDGKKADKVRDLKNFEDKAETKVLLKQFMKDNDIIVDDILMSDK
jgi:WD40 repeat protein